jgi:hypothetical protein
MGALGSLLLSLVQIGLTGVLASALGFASLIMLRKSTTPVTIPLWGAIILGAISSAYMVLTDPKGFTLVGTIVNLLIIWFSATVVTFVVTWLSARGGRSAPFAWGKPELGVEQYAPLLQATLSTLNESRDHLDAQRLTISQAERAATYMQERSLFFERLNARRLELESVRPDHRVAQVHTEAVKLARAVLTLLNLGSEAIFARWQGDEARFQKKLDEIESWGTPATNVRKKLERALSGLEDTQPSIYQLLALPPITLAFRGRFGLFDI